MLKRALYFIFCVCPFIVWANESYSEVGKKLLNSFWHHVQEHDSTYIANKLVPSFQGFTEDGDLRNKSQEIDFLKTLHIKKYKITNLSVRHYRDTLTIFYTLQIQLSRDPSTYVGSQMCVFRKIHGAWKIQSRGEYDFVSLEDT